MRQILIPALLLSLLAGCSGGGIGPHRIDVQQGNALDQENVARLKPGLNRSQVRFLLGTPLVVDPFRNDRWDYVYVYYKAGKLAEQKRITLFFEGDTLVRIEGDVPPPAEAVPAPAPAPALTPARTPQPEVVARPAAAETRALTAEPAPQAQPLAAVETPAPQPATAAPQRAVVAPQPATPAPQPAVVAPQPAEVATPPAPARALPTAAAPAPRPAEPAPLQAATRPESAAPAVETVAAASPAPVPARAQPAGPATSIVPPLPSPKDAPPYANKRPPAQLSLQAETAVEQIQPDIIPPFPDPQAAPGPDAAVLAAVKAWSEAWARRDEDRYIAAYDAAFVPQGGGSRADWEQRRRLLLGLARNIDVRIESPTVERVADGVALVTFNQHYRSDSYRDSVVKQLRMVERDGRWLIAEENVLTILRGAQR